MLRSQGDVNVPGDGDGAVKESGIAGRRWSGWKSLPTKAVAVAVAGQVADLPSGGDNSLTIKLWQGTVPGSDFPRPGSDLESPVESLAQLVSESLTRNGFQTALDHRRLQWSAWSPCDDIFSALLLPARPGLLALGEEIVPAAALSATGGKRMLALCRILEADDLGMALAHRFAPDSPDHERMTSGRFFFRYALMEDAGQRGAAFAALERWMESSSDKASGFGDFAA